VELIAIIFMVVAGGAIALFVMLAMAIARRENERKRQPAPRRESIAASLLVQVVIAGGAGVEEAIREVRRRSGLAAPVTPDIDVGNWAATYARDATPEQRASLLETAVQLVAAKARPVPLLQYAALLDLSFGLGFQTDALAKLRQTYGFDYVDHAKDARPRHADRAGGGAPLFVRDTRPRAELLHTLGVPPEATRREITAAYRKLVAQHHPDRYHAARPEEQTAAAARFIEITKAYEELMLIVRE
jgi:DnaJ domain